MSNLAYAPESSFYDRDYDLAEAQAMAREEAREAIINTLLAGEEVRFSLTESWSLEEILGEYLVVPEKKLDQSIAYEQS